MSDKQCRPETNASEVSGLYTVCSGLSHGKYGTHFSEDFIEISIAYNLARRVAFLNGS